jgi:predicted metal-dependent hydrolase
MSNIESNEVLAEEAPALEGEGQLQEVQDAVDALTDEQIELLPVDEFGDKYVTVTVDGEEVRVPLKEALSGYQRQADYTRKTQELSEQRRQVQFGAALQEALQKNPKETLDLLSQHYGLAQQAASEEEELYVDPVEKQYRQLEQRVQAFEQQKAMDELERTVQSLEQRYGSDFDANEVVAKALALGSTDLEAVYKQIAFDKVYEDAKALRLIREKKAVEAQQITDAKRQAAVASGGTTASSADVSARPITSLRDAWDAAKRQVSV